jgi:hypothetical protein
VPDAAEAIQPQDLPQWWLQPCRAGRQSIKRAARGLALTPFAAKGEPCPRNNTTPIGNFSAMSWNCCAALASLAAAPRRACRFFGVPGSSARQLAAI